jgi:hypothetical protein
MSNIFIGSYPQITEVGGDDLLPVIQGGELKNATKNNVLGYRSFIAKFKQDDEDAITQTTFLNTTGTAIPTINYYFDEETTPPYYEIEFNGEFNVHIDNMTSYDNSKNTFLPIYRSFDIGFELVGYFTIAQYLSDGNTYVYFYFFDTLGDPVSFYDIMGANDEYYLPEIKLFDIPA